MTVTLGSRRSWPHRASISTPRKLWSSACARSRWVPITPEHGSVEENKAAWAVLTQFDKPFVTAFSDADPITGGGDAVFQKLVPGAKDQPHVTLEGAHFLQEDCPADIVAVIEGVLADR